MSYSGIAITGDLVLKENNSIVGHRIFIEGKYYDISSEDLALIQDDFKIICTRTDVVDTFKLIAKGVLLIHENPKDDVKEFKYCDYAVMQGYSEMRNTDTELKRCYNEWNARAFSGVLPKMVAVEWSNRITSTAGDCLYLESVSVPYRIRLSVGYHNTNPHEIIETLVHEMIHVQHYKHSHNEVFLREMRRINKAFNLGVTVYAHGEVAYKYIYDCVACNEKYYRVKRLNVQTNVCGRCSGKLILAQDLS